MTITWFGQSCFRVEAKEGSILIDPFSKDIGLKPPRPKDDVVLITHEHHDHNNREGIDTQALIVANPGEFERKGIIIQGIPSYHDTVQGAERGLNTIYRIRAEGINVCHLGDLGQSDLTDEQVEAIGDVDVLMIPVGGTYTIDAKLASRIVSRIEPKIIIPMHYAIPKLTITLDSVDAFVKEVGLTAEKTDKLKIQSKTLPIDETKLTILSL